VESVVPIGIINDDTNEVGKVHLGILYHINLNNKSIEINEKEKMTGIWVKKSDLHEYYPQMESWSKIYVDLQKL
jgi:predicted NUDIX family phosphoesterase